MAEVKDYYKILGVDEKADADTIKKAYRKLARQYHPDRNPDDPKAEERFKEVQEANDILSDEKKRKEYDHIRKNPFGAFGGRGFQTRGGNQYYQSSDGTYIRFDDMGGGDFGDGFGGIGDFINRMFGGGGGPNPSADPFGRQRPPQRGRDVETHVSLSFEQALEGGKTDVLVPDGDRIRITIPKGVRDGYKIRLKERGEASRSGGPRGHLFVTFDVAEHPRFRREGDDLYTTVEINAFEAMLGTEQHLTNAYGRRIKLPIPAGTQPGATLRLRNQGVKTEKGTGNLYVEINVAVPQNLTDEQQAAVREAGEQTGLL